MIDFETRLKEAADEWLAARAPFIVRGHSKVHGVDCVHLAHALYTQAGVELPEIQRDYFVDESRHNRTQKLTDWIEQSGKFREIEIRADYPVGTLLCADIGLAPYHVAVIFSPGRAIHSLRRMGVCAVSEKDRLLVDAVTHAYEVIL